ncbi:MAG: ACT domain-containing protein, partial [Clostridia bacterium]
ARCCNPVPGDDVIGYITRGRGVTVHKADCINAKHSEEERKVEVTWDTAVQTDYVAEVQVVAYDHDGLLADLAVLIGGMNVPIEAVSARAHKNGTCTIMLTIKITGKQQLDRVIRSLQKRSDVVEVFRVSA